MGPNLVSLVMQFLTPDMIAKIAAAVGLDRSIVQKAIEGAVPALLSSLAGVASTPDGAGQLSKVLAQQTGSLDSLKNLTGPSGQKAPPDAGLSLLSGLLGGSTLDVLTQAISRFAGVGAGASASLLGMLGPIVVAVLSQHQRSAGLDAGGLASQLASQKEQIAAVIPRGLADQLSATGLTDVLEGGLRSGGAASASAAGNRMSDAVGRTVSDTVRAPQATSGRSSQWLYWVVALVILAGLSWYFLGRSGHETVAEAPTAAPPPAGQASSTPPPAGQTSSAPPPAGQASSTTNAASPDIVVGDVNLVNQVNTSVNSLKTALSGITDTASAQAALPKIQNATAQLNDVGTLAAKLSPDNKNALAKLISTAMATINPLFDKVLAIPGVDSIAKPAIDEARGKLDALAKA